MDPQSFYEPTEDPDVVRATELTRGPWSVGHQHGGPPSALLTRAVQRFGDEPEAFAIGRVGVELLRPIPIGPVKVEVRPLRTGRRVEWLDAALLDLRGEELARARVLRVRRTPLELPPPKDPPAPPLADPDTLEPFSFPFFTTRLGYHSAVDLRVAKGVWSREPTAAWIRPRVPLLPDEPITPVQAVVVAADAANGVGYVLDVRRYMFVNPDLTIHFAREPAGTWVGLDTHTAAASIGLGLCQAEVHDRQGPVGRALLTLVLSARQASA